MQSQQYLINNLYTLISLNVFRVDVFWEITIYNFMCMCTCKHVHVRVLSVETLNRIITHSF